MRLLALIALLSISEHSPAKVVPEHIEGPWRVDVSRAAGLDYIVLEPRDVREGTPLPTIVYLHGRSARARIPDPDVYAMRARIIVPRAPEPSGAGFAWMPVSASRGESEALVSALDARTEQLARAIDAWSARYAIEGRPIAVGFSQGGMLAISLALHHPERVSRAIAMASWYPPSRVMERRVPITMLHGASDPVLDAERSRAIAAVIGARFELFDGAHEVPPAMARRLRQLLLRA